jgi:ATP-dependent helicase Lhr and Lhr-like helicase
MASPLPQLRLDFSSAAPGSADDALAGFHPVVQAWFAHEIGSPSAPQRQGWPLIRDGRSVVIAAPTGSGKTLTAFLACVDQLFRDAAAGTLRDETSVLYVSPLKALGNDVQKNLLTPLEQLRARAAAQGRQLPEVRVLVRTGDTPASERAAMVKRPPHILITTPESLYLYLTSAKARATLRSVRTVVVDELHALARDKRGSHFALSMERLKALLAEVGQPAPQCIGLSATIEPVDALARFLVASPTGDDTQCTVVRVGHQRPWELVVETPDDELSAVPTHEMWGQLYGRLEQLSQANRTMLVFSNTRRLAERVAHDMGERLGHEVVAAHHGSMARELRLSAENRLKAGQLKIMVATASLELGLDIGSIDLVVQLGTPRSISVMLQRLGRAGHRVSAISRGVLFAMTRDELVECTALLHAIVQGRLDAVRQPVAPLDVLAQQVVAEVATRDWSERALFDVFRRAAPYQALQWSEFECVLQLVSEGVGTVRGRSRVHVHRDRVNGVLKARKGARLMALQNGGAIPDLFTYAVIAEPDDKQVGTLDEDFAIDSSAGDVFVLGSTSWRIRRVTGGEVRVENANGHAPNVPFWQGEAPARTDELSAQVAHLRERIVQSPDARSWLERELCLAPRAADALCRYVQAGATALNAVPGLSTVVAERFFDEAGGMQLILHAPFGARINRAWGLALRKSFCRAFDFELQAAATDDGILLSLGEQHSFPLLDIFDFVSPQTAAQVLTQAVLQAPMFGTRFRWAAGRALALSRFHNGHRVPPPIQRARAEDLIAAVFPEQVGCQDNHGGAELTPPDHPLVNETMKDCTTDLMDIEGLVRVLEGLKHGSIRKVAVDAPEPSVFAHQLLNSAPYTFLDDAPLEERRARTVALRRALPANDVAAFGTLEAQAIAQVVDEAKPPVRDMEELHDLLLQLGVAPLQSLAPLAGPGLLGWLDALLAEGRAHTFGGEDEPPLVVAAERVPLARSLFAPSASALVPLPADGPVELEVAARTVVRGWVEVVGPVSVDELMVKSGLGRFEVESGLVKLELVGQVLRGRFRPSHPIDAEPEWCDRRLLQRIHRLTVGRLRREIEPLSASDYMRFLFRWHQVGDAGALSGPQGVVRAVGLLEGWEAPASAWESALLPSRVRNYVSEWLDHACFSGEVVWGRLTQRDPKPPLVRRGLAVEGPPPKRPALGRAALLSFASRANVDWLLTVGRPVLADGPRPLPAALGPHATAVLAVLERKGACFFTDLAQATRLLPTDIEDALWELLALGLVTADAVQNLRVLQSVRLRREQQALKRGGPGRWSLLRPTEPCTEEESLEQVAQLFLRRYGIVFRDVVMREALAPPWREVLAVYRRLEARGSLRGGRFVSGFAGEQFALPEAVDAARATRRLPGRGERVRVSAVDPLNLTGVVTPGERVPAVSGHWVDYVDGVPEAVEAAPANELAEATPIDSM